MSDPGSPKVDGGGVEPTGSASNHIVVNEKDVRRIAFGAFVGTALEWYDYFLFGLAAALVFNRLFFTDLNDVAAAMAAFATFGVGFLARPLGAWLFGLMGDRVGRRPVLIISIIAIGTATGLVGLLPDYGAIGVAAPIALTVLRLLQGLAVGGEWGGATTLAIEHAPPERRARYASWVQLGSPVGTLMSSAAFALVLVMPEEQFDAYGWRIPFLAAFPLLAVALWIRMRVEESPVFQQLEEQADAPKVGAFDVFRKGAKPLAIAVAAAFLGVGGFYIMNTYVVSYATTVLGVERQLVVNATLAAAAVQIIVIVFAGRFAEKIGPGKLMGWGGILTAALAWPLWALIDTGSIIAITLAICLGIGSLTISYAVTGAVLSELFPAQLRYSGVSLGYNIAGALSGFLPFIATALTGQTDEPSSGAAIALLIVVALITATAGFIASRNRVVDDIVVSSS